MAAADVNFRLDQDVKEDMEKACRDMGMTMTDPEGIHDVLNKLQLIFHFTELSEADLIRASEMEWKDFEDAIQCATAERIGADYILTRNVKDFLQSRKVFAFTPSEFLERYL